MSHNVMTRFELQQALRDRLNMTEQESSDALNGFLSVISNSIEIGSNLKLSAFGNFIQQDKSERIGRNPKNGEEYPISARRVVRFWANSKTKKFFSGSLK